MQSAGCTTPYNRATTCLRQRGWCVVALLLCILSRLAAGEVILVGDVLNESTGEPVANVHLYLQGTQEGTTSNEDGSFCLKADIDRKRRLVISAVGYHTQRYDIEPNTMAGMQVLLKERVAVLDEVVAMPGENPALPLIAKVRIHRNGNNRFLLPGKGEYDTRTDLYISHIGKRQLQRHLWKSLRAGMLTRDDSTLLLPLYTSSQDVILEGKHTIPAGEKKERALVLSATDYSVLLTPPQNLNFYQNTVDILGESFLSPLASSGSMYYRYYLADSVPGAYLVHFRTKNPFYATFNGEMWIDSATYAVRSLQAEVPAQSRVNYLSQLRIRQSFLPDHRLADESVSVLLDFAVKTDTTRYFPTVLIQSGMRTKQPVPATAGGAYIPDAPRREAGLPVYEGDADPFAALDSVPLIRVAKFAATVLTTGYIPTGTCVDIGNILEIADFGESEYVHVGLPLRTNGRLWKNVSLEAAAGYGWHDQRWKGLGRISINLPTQRRNILRAEYQDHYISTEVDDFYRYHHENSFGKGRWDLTAWLFRNLHTNRNAVNTYSRQRQFELRAESDWSKMLETNLYIRAGRWDPWYTEQATGNLSAHIAGCPSYRYQSLGGVFRLGWGERKVDGYFLRKYVYGHYPTLFIGAEAGSWTPVAGDSRYNLYAKCQIMVKQHAQLGMGGSLDWAFAAGYIFGNVPFPMLHHFEGNQSYAFDPYRFTLLNDLRYSSRAWLSVHALWDGEGVLFNLISGVRYLHLHELVEAKAAWGDGEIFRHPYTEVGVGIGNILRVGEVYAVWRLTNRRDTSSPTWGIRFRFHLGL